MNKALKRFKRVKFSDTRYGRLARLKRAIKLNRIASINVIASCTISQIQQADGGKFEKYCAIAEVMLDANNAINELL